MSKGPWRTSRGASADYLVDRLPDGYTECRSRGWGLPSGVPPPAWSRVGYRVYCLVDPRDGAYRYVGQTQEPDLAYYVQHKTLLARGKERAVGVEVWLLELDGLGLRPRWLVLELHQTKTEALEAERYWIAQLLRVGHPLVNVVGRPTY